MLSDTLFVVEYLTYNIYILVKRTIMYRMQHRLTCQMDRVCVPMALTTQ